MQVHGWALRGGLAQQGRHSEGPATACRESEAEVTGWVKTREGSWESSRQESLQEQTFRSRRSWRREERTKRDPVWLGQLQGRVGEGMSTWGWKHRNRLVCLKPMGAPEVSEEWREITQLVLKGLLWL